MNKQAIQPAVASGLTIQSRTGKTTTPNNKLSDR